MHAQINRWTLGFIGGLLLATTLAHAEDLDKEAAEQIWQAYAKTSKGQNERLILCGDRLYSKWGFGGPDGNPTLHETRDLEVTLEPLPLNYADQLNGTTWIGRGDLQGRATRDLALKTMTWGPWREAEQAIYVYALFKEQGRWIIGPTNEGKFISVMLLPLTCVTVQQLLAKAKPYSLPK